MLFLRKAGFTVLITAVAVFGSYNFTLGSAAGKVIKKGNVCYMSNTLIVKLKQTSALGVSGKSALLTSKVSDALTSFSASSVNKVFAKQAGSNESVLDGIVEIKYNSDADPFYVAAKLKNNPDVEWAEPRFLYKVSSVPNDPLYANQWGLQLIKAEQAWDVTKGDSAIIIAIVDTGVDWDHPDLAANMWINKKEIPGNGIDDDNNGYVDDVHGWDFGGLSGLPDNNPMEDRPDHGTHVAGIASAVTNNSAGIASIGYRTKLMAVKTAQDNVRDPGGEAYISYGYEGIIYAVDNGAKIINCSWGGEGFSILAQNVISYAVSKGALVVSSSGNDNSVNDYYPAYYEGVLSVGSTNSKDQLSSFSNYGKKLSVCAPGEGIVSTWQNDSYAILNGTSMASPLAAGLAALVASKFPSYNPYQIAEQIRVNTDNIDASNLALTGLIGSGRINAYKAVSNTNSKSVRAIDVQISDAAPGGNGNGIIESGETIALVCRFVNYLSPVSGTTIKLESKNNYSTVTQGTFTTGSVATLGTFDNSSNKFQITISNSTPFNTALDYKLTYSDGTNTDFQWISFVANPSFSTQTGNNISLTINSKGSIGFNDYPDNTQGSGFKYKTGNNLLFEGALMLATSATRISDEARNSDGSLQDADFVTTQPFIIKIPGTIADIEGTAIYNDNGAGSNKVGVSITQSSYTFTNDNDKNYIILRYNIKNNNSSAINNLYAGLFLDWDILESSGKGDLVQYDTLGKLGYTYHFGGSPDEYTASALVSSGNNGFWAILNDGTDGGFQIYDGFSDQEKWQALSSGIGKSKAGVGDISSVTSGGPYSIAAGGSVDVAFALAAGLSLDELRTAVTNAKKKYQQIITTAVEDKPIISVMKYNIDQNYPNPFNPSTIINYQIEKEGNVSLKVYDVLGREIAVLVDEVKPAGSYSAVFNSKNIKNGGELSSGIYFYKLQSGSYIGTKKMLLLR